MIYLSKVIILFQPGTINPTMLSDMLREHSFLKYEEATLTDSAYTDCLACRENIRLLSTYWRLILQIKNFSFQKVSYT